MTTSSMLARSVVGATMLATCHVAVGVADLPPTLPTKRAVDDSEVGEADAPVVVGGSRWTRRHWIPGQADVVVVMGGMDHLIEGPAGSDDEADGFGGIDGRMDLGRKCSGSSCRHCDGAVEIEDGGRSEEEVANSTATKETGSSLLTAPMEVLRDGSSDVKDVVVVVVSSSSTAGDCRGGEDSLTATFWVGPIHRSDLTLKVVGGSHDCHLER
ncbi:hypothetical protein ACLOJK_013056 [Asimina triloba]